MDSNSPVRKRLASQLDDEDESVVRNRKRMRLSLDAGAKRTVSSRSCVSQVAGLQDSAGKNHRTVASPVSSNMATAVVKRGRGRPRRVSCLAVHCRIYCNL